ncbi:hypothetical protein NDU88_003931 [Pleurodeles waltl]|uniref:Uncharacterized protein n=1 Tax=Pleurodeles waltl TaxID=8319 RepID=A0AAV7WT27_PLEWA|nr:hypothetical protein NDU88_003931 [Pleurodeles waltl]
MASDKVRKAMLLLEEAGRLGILVAGMLPEDRPVCSGQCGSGGIGMFTAAPGTSFTRAGRTKQEAATQRSRVRDSKKEWGGIQLTLMRQQ